MPSSVKFLTALKIEAYQRTTDEDGYGFNLSGDFRYKRYSLSAGVMSVQVRPPSPDVHRMEPKPPLKPMATNPSPPGTMIVAALAFSVSGTVTGW